jgi:C1A family cysteine protease
MYLMPARNEVTPDEERVTPPEVSEEEMRQGRDWVSSGAVTPVRLQKCNDCYTFSAVAALEGSWKVKSNKLVPMSEQ